MPGGGGRGWEDVDGLDGNWLLSFFVFLLFLGPLPRHMEVPRLGVQSELWPPILCHTAARNFFFFFFVFFLFLGPLPRHMEVPRLGVEAEL